MNTSPSIPNPPPTGPDPLAVALSKLEPTPHGFEWNSFMFAAGRASKGRAILTWQVTAALLALVVGALAYAYFARPPAVVERERIVYVDRVVEKPAEVPLPAPLPLPKPEVKPEPKPEAPGSPAPQSSAGWVFDPPPEQGAAARWLNTRNEVLTVGLSVLPDRGPKVSPSQK
ncbi:MAG: hypothetical protein L0241_00495 [Planctomycetia bacterium]|nr:hypothetical protein [Planctomycetia bacterium]